MDKHTNTRVRRIENLKKKTTNGHKWKHVKSKLYPTIVKKKINKTSKVHNHLPIYNCRSSHHKIYFLLSNNFSFINFDIWNNIMQVDNNSNPKDIIKQ